MRVCRTSTCTSWEYCTSSTRTSRICRTSSTNWIGSSCTSPSSSWTRCEKSIASCYWCTISSCIAIPNPLWRTSPSTQIPLTEQLGLNNVLTLINSLFLISLHIQKKIQKNVKIKFSFTKWMNKWIYKNLNYLSTSIYVWKSELFRLNVFVCSDSVERFLIGFEGVRICLFFFVYSQEMPTLFGAK